MAGEGEGITLTLEGKIGPTRDVHRLIQLAKTKGTPGTENKLVTEIFKAHFEDGHDITSDEMLVSAGEKAGLFGAEIHEWLKTGGGGEEVDRRVNDATLRGIRAVPDIVINEDHKLVGVQDTTTFLEVFLRVKKSSGDISIQGLKEVN